MPWTLSDMNLKLHSSRIKSNKESKRKPQKKSLTYMGVLKSFQDVYVLQKEEEI